ncbi:hypothetical protein D3C75_884200 [compost metagenome]
MVLLAPGLKGAQNGGSQQATDVLAHAEQHRKTDQVTRVGYDAANPGQHRRGEEKGAAEAQQELAHHQLIRAGQAAGLAVEQGGDDHQH